MLNKHEGIFNLLFKKPYFVSTILIFFLYILISLLITGFYDTIPLILKYASTVNWIKLSLSVFLTLIIGLLVSINAVFFFIKYRERKKCNEAAATASLGTLTGLAAGVCPLCVTGLFPLLFGVFGISFSFASLPFQGIEVQLLAVVILSISLKMLPKQS